MSQTGPTVIEEDPIPVLSESPTWPATVSSSPTILNNTLKWNSKEDCVPADMKESSSWSRIWKILGCTASAEIQKPSNDGGEMPDRSIARFFGRVSKLLLRKGNTKRVFSIRSLKTFPRGYPNFAAFLDSDEGFMLYRRYGYLQSRILLEKQDELRLLEEQLDAIDKSEMYEKPHRLFTRGQQGDERKGILAQIETAFCEYAKFLNAAQQLMSLSRPGKAEHNSVLNYVEGLTPVEKKESQYIYYKDDLITLRPGREHAWLDRSIEQVLRIADCRPLRWIFCTKETQEKSLDEYQVYYDRDRIGGCAGIVVLLMIVFMLIVPIYLEYHIITSGHGLLSGRRTAMCMTILLVFTLAFAAMMSCFTKAKRHEVLGAAAAYCPVLVVFLGNVGN